MDAVVLYPQIGTKEDTANSAGSLHAKSTELLDVAGRKGVFNRDFKQSTLSNCEIDTDGSVKLSTGQIFGTVTEDVAVKHIARWLAYSRKVYVPDSPGTQTITCAIKDISDNVLISNVSEGQSLATIDAKIYKTLRVVHTLTRASTADASPKLHYRDVSWLGSDHDALIGKTPRCIALRCTMGDYTDTTIANITGSGYLLGITAVCPAMDSIYSADSTSTLTIDGVDLINANNLLFAQGHRYDPSNYSSGHNSMSMFYRFDKLLKIAFKVRNAYFYITYILD